MEGEEDRISKRYFILDRLDYYIQESVYYRSYSDDIGHNVRQVLYNNGDESGSIVIK
jgi:hypothetical protein